MCLTSPLECNHDPSGQELKTPLQIKLERCLLQEVITDYSSTSTLFSKPRYSLTHQVLSMWPRCCNDSPQPPPHTVGFTKHSCPHISLRLQLQPDRKAPRGQGCRPRSRYQVKASCLLGPSALVPLACLSAFPEGLQFSGSQEPCLMLTT